jgi:hypothetical protein
MKLRSGISLSARCKLFSEYCGERCVYAGVARLLGLVSVCARMASLNVPVVPSISTQHCKFCVLACARDWSSVGGGLCSVSASLAMCQLWRLLPDIFAQAPDSYKVHGCPLLRSFVGWFVCRRRFVACCAVLRSTHFRSDSMKSDFAQQCK